MQVPRPRLACPFAAALAAAALAGPTAAGHAQPSPHGLGWGPRRAHSSHRAHHKRHRHRRRRARSPSGGGSGATIGLRAATAATASAGAGANLGPIAATAAPIVKSATPESWLPPAPSPPPPATPAEGAQQPPAPPAEGTPPQPPAPSGPPAPQDPFAGQHLYVESGSPAAQTQRQWSAEGRAAEAAEIGKIASQPVAKWFGDWSYGHGGTAGDVGWWVGAAGAAGALPVLVAYDIPWRDCSQYSAGGAPSASAYEQFIDAMAAGIAGRRAVVIVEPDALPELECLPAEEQAVYYELLSYAVTHLSADPLVSVYLDAGHAGWQTADTMAGRLRKAGVAGARGFSLNVSSFDTTASETAYGGAIAAQLGAGAHFVIDTGRNGRGPAPGGAWCNPPGRGLGQAPTDQTGNALLDAYLWVKQPGASDGACEGGPSAGQWWSAYALELARNAVG